MIPFPTLPPGFNVQVEVTEIVSKPRDIGVAEPYGDGFIFYPLRGCRTTTTAFAIGGDTTRRMPSRP